MFKPYEWASGEIREALGYEYHRKFIDYFHREPTIEELLLFYRLLHPKRGIK